MHEIPTLLTKARQILSRLVKNISLYFKRRHLIIYKNYILLDKENRTLHLTPHL